MAEAKLPPLENRKCLFFRNKDLCAAHIRPEDLGDSDASVCLKVIFKKCDEHSRGSDDGVIKRMRKISSVFTLYTHLETASLSIAEI